MVLFSIRKISKDDRALINFLRQENWSSQRLFRKFSEKNWAGQAWTCCWRKLILLAWQNHERQQPSAITLEKNRTSGWANPHSFTFCTSTKVRMKLKGRTVHGRLFSLLQSMIFGWKSTSACQGRCDSIDGATLISKVVSNKLQVMLSMK